MVLLGHHETSFVYHPVYRSIQDTPIVINLMKELQYLQYANFSANVYKSGALEENR